ncbi:hypothetical protein ACLQ18_39390 [Streptomyces sp. DT193]|uniref:hypothetical protein n=1 Tax=Streptomyces sp. DT193 TaxID=3393418 RepID=UPI003CF1B91A
MHPVAVHDIRVAQLRAEADAYRLAKKVRHPTRLRTRVGWTLIEVGMRLAEAPKTAAAVP